MKGGDTVKTALVVTSNEKIALYFSNLLGGEFDRVEIVESGYGARNDAAIGDYSFILIDSPLCDEAGCDLAAVLSLSSPAGIVYLVKNSLLAEMTERLSEFGIFVVEKPISKQLFLQAMKLSVVGSHRVEKLKSENDRLYEKIEELRLVDRAKLVLVSCLNMTEQQAHRYIEKQSMDLRLPKTEVAKNILTTYEN